VRDRLVLITRSSIRKFSYQEEIELALEVVAGAFGYRYTLFSDKSLPPFEEQLKIFNEAAIVVGPHGAGMGNLLFAEDGTLVVEGVCNLPKTNTLYLYLNQRLGHRYHAVISHFGCDSVLDIRATEIVPSLIRMLLHRLHRLDHSHSQDKTVQLSFLVHPHDPDPPTFTHITQRLDREKPPKLDLGLLQNWHNL